MALANNVTGMFVQMNGEYVLGGVFLATDAYDSARITVPLEFGHIEKTHGLGRKGCASVPEKSGPRTTFAIETVPAGPDYQTFTFG